MPPIVLLVEDDADTRDLYETALVLSGLWVAKAADPGDALEYATDLRPDSILMDVGLPTPVDGFSLARAFRDQPRLAHTPIVGVTGFDAEKIQPGLDLFTTVFYKPVAVDALVRRLRWLSAKSAVLRERAWQGRARAPELSVESEKRMQGSLIVQERLPDALATKEADAARYCPKCRVLLRFAERRILSGTTFDYYAPCSNGCGIYYYDHSRRKMFILVD